MTPQIIVSQYFLVLTYLFPLPTLQKNSMVILWCFIWDIIQKEQTGSLELYLPSQIKEYRQYEHFNTFKRIDAYKNYLNLNNIQLFYPRYFKYCRLVGTQNFLLFPMLHKMVQPLNKTTEGVIYNSHNAQEDP